MKRGAALLSLALTVPAWLIAALLLNSWYTDTHETCGVAPLWDSPVLFLVTAFGIAALLTAALGRRRRAQRTQLGVAAYLSSSLVILWSFWFFFHTFKLFDCGFGLM